MTGERSAVAELMAEAASAFLEALDAGQRAKATFEFSDAKQRTDWAYFPRNHAGLPLLEQDARQQKLLHVLLTSALSLHAYGKVTSIMALESVLNLLEGRQADAVRDPGRYFISVFGAPGEDRWGWRYEGHHVCLNFTIADGEVASATPIFLGANPAEVRHGGAIVLRPCAEEEDAARELMSMLGAELRAEALISEIAPPDFVLMNLPVVPDSALPGEAGALPQVQERFDEMTGEDKEALRFELARPRGIAAANMDAKQRLVLSDLIEVYVSRLSEPLASAERAKISIDDVCFAWAGPMMRRRQPHYYRLQGTSFLAEYDNTQNDANHIHAVWRNPDGDFGGDALRAHLAREH